MIPNPSNQMILASILPLLISFIIICVLIRSKEMIKRTHNNPLAFWSLITFIAMGWFASDIHTLFQTYLVSTRQTNAIVETEAARWFCIKVWSFYLGTWIAVSSLSLLFIRYILKIRQPWKLLNAGNWEVSYWAAGLQAGLLIFIKPVLLFLVERLLPTQNSYIFS